jgi:hypothetical protein
VAVAAIVERIVPETRYAQSGDVSIAYEVVGDGPLDLGVRPRLGLERRALLGRPEGGEIPAAPRLVLAPDPLRQARHRRASRSTTAMVTS